MKKNKIKYKGRLKSYFQWPAMILAVMVLVNILIYLISFRAGIVVSLFVLFQLILTFYLMFRSRPRTDRSKRRCWMSF